MQEMCDGNGSIRIFIRERESWMKVSTLLENREFRKKKKKII